MKRGSNKMLLVVVIIIFMITIEWNSVFAQQSISSSLGLVPYPSQGQTATQQNQDEGECYSWAKGQTGIDPVAVANAPADPSGPAVGGGERVGGAAKGALAGAALGSITGESGRGAGAGAIVGTLAGGRKARHNQQAQAQQTQDTKAATIQHFNKAFSACLEGKGYIVK